MIIRLDELEWDRGVPNTLETLDLWGVQPLIELIQATLEYIEDGPKHFLVNEIGQKAQDLSTAINRLADTYKEEALKPE